MQTHGGHSAALYRIISILDETASEEVLSCCIIFPVILEMAKLREDFNKLEIK